VLQGATVPVEFKAIEVYKNYLKLAVMSGENENITAAGMYSKHSVKVLPSNCCTCIR